MKVALTLVAVLALAGAGVGAYLYVREPAAAPADTPEAAVGRILAGGGGALIAPWLSSATIVELESAGRFARAIVSGGGRLATVLMVQGADGLWRSVSVSESAPACAAVERYGFPSALIADCTVGVVSTVAAALAGGGGEVRLFGVVEISDDPSCQGCVFLTSGGASVRLSVTEEELAAAGINVGDAVLVTGEIGESLTLDATAVVAISGGEAGSSGGGGEGQGGTSDAGSSQPSASTPNQPSQPYAPPAEPSVPSAPPIDTAPPQPGAPRRYKPTTWYANPLDLDTSSVEMVDLVGD